MANPTIVAASLDDKELQQSIANLVAHVKRGLHTMLTDTNSTVEEMEKKLKSLGNLKIDSGSAADGGSSKRAAGFEKLQKSVNDASASLQKHQNELVTLKNMLGSAQEQENSFLQAKQNATNTISKENELLQRQEQELANLKTQQSSFIGTNQQTTASIDKQRESVANLKNEVKYWQSVVSQMQNGDKKLRFNSLWLGDTTSKQGHDILDVANKLYSIMQKLGMETEKGSASTSQAVRAAEELAKYYKISREEAEKLILSVQESPLARGKYTTHYDTRFGLDNLTMQQKAIDDFALRKELAQGKLTFETDNLTLANKRLEESEKAVASASSQRSQLDSQIAAKEKEIAETKVRITAATKEQSDAEKDASQAAQVRANVESKIVTQEKIISDTRQQLTSATKALADAEKQTSDGGASKRAKAQNAETDAVEKNVAARDRQIKKNQEAAMSFDQMAAATQKANGGSKMSVIETYDMQIEMLKNRLREVRQDIDIFNAAIGSGKKTQIEWGQQGLKQANAEAEKLMRTITTLENQRGNLASVLAPQGHTIQNYVNSLQKANPELARLNDSFKRGQSLMQNGIITTQQLANSQGELNIKTNQQKQTLDEMNAYIAQNIRMEQERRAAIRQTGLAARESADQLIRSAHEQASAQGKSPITGTKELTEAVEKMRSAYFDMSASEKASPIGLALEADIKRANDAIAVIRKYNQSLLGSQQNDANKITNASTLNSLRESLKNLTEQYNKLTVAELNAGKGDALIQHFQDTTRAAQILQRTLNRPVNLKAALSGDERTLDDIAYKMQRLRSYRQGIDLTKPNAANEIKQVDEALARLQKDADKWMSKSQDLIKNNTALGRSWNYMKNRLAFYFTVGASTQFVKNLIEVRSQYEMNERALGILIDSAERGTQIFNELSQMALVSPYTLIELSSAAKQLTAYDVAAKDVVDTTRRLADMAAAVGIPIERLTYALGQIKAYGYLNSRDARMFANAGIPLVKQLSDYYTELEGRLVSTADVYDRIKKKSIDYNEVMEVMYKMTDQGGKFFDFQAKMADTLKVRLANLTLAWNNMLNDMGKESQGVLTWGIGALRDLFLQWKQLDNLIKNAALAVGVRTLLVALRAATIGLGSFGKEMTWNAILGKKLGGVVVGLAKSFGTLFSSRLTWFALLAIAAVEATQAIFGVNEAQKALNESIRNGAKDNYDNISKFLEQYKEVRESLYSTRKVAIGSIYNPTTRKAEATSYAEQQVGQDIDKNEAKKAWEAVREQIELTVASSDKYIGNLLSISNMSERVRQGFNLLDDIQVVNAALKELDDDTIKVSKDLSAWWNAWQAPDGLIGNLKDYQEALNDIIAKYGTLESFRENTFLGGKGSDDLNDYQTALERFRDDLQKTTDSILNFIELKGWSGDESKINQVFEQITQKLVLDNQLDPQKAFTLQIEAEEARSKAAKQALLQRINDEKAALKIANDESVREALAADVERYNNWNETNGRSKVEWERFTKWLKEQHISETTAMFRNMDTEDIKSLNFQEGKHAEWVTRMVTQYAKEHKMSYDEAFKYLRSWVRSANQWSIFIPLTISTEDKKSVYDQLGEYDKAVDEADAQIERLTKRIGELNAKKQKSKEETQELANAEQELADAQKAKADAEAKGGHGKKEKKDERDSNKAAKQAESELQKALKDELSTIDKVRSIYKDLTKEGMSHADAVERATRGWDETVNSINKVLRKNGLQKLDLSKFAGIENPRELVNILQSQLNTLLKRGAKPTEIKELQTKVNTLEVDADKYDLTKITKGLNNELGKLKDEYELAVELDANPELGDIFADMFGINTSTLPKTFGDALDRAQIIINRKLAEMNITTPFDLMEGNIDSFAKSAGLDKDSALIKELVSAQNAYRDMFKKNITETEKVLDDYIKKYGDYSDKIAEIEANRLEKLKKLNEAYYTEEMRKRPEYLAKLNAIEQGASKEKQQVDFDEFKNSRYYTMMFENLDYISTKTLTDMRDRLRDYINTAKDLNPEQLKTLISQYEKIEQKVVKRSPFKTLAKDLKEYFKTSKERKSANAEFKNAQKEYDVQKKNVAELKKKYEQAKANSNTSQAYLDFLQIEIDGENEVLRILKEQLEAAEEKANKYNLIKKLALEEAAGTANMVATNLQSLGELRDQFNELFGVDASKGETLFGHNIDGMVDGLAKAGQSISKIISSATNGDVFGVVGGVVGVFTGIGDSIASIFGDGAARTRRLNREINNSIENVRKLTLAYKDLEYAVENEMGAAELQARRQEIVNKEAQLRELQRQKQLEEQKRSKDRDDDRIKELESSIKDLQIEIKEMADDVAATLLGGKVKDAAEEFVNTWVDAWRAGEDTMAAIDSKFDDMIDNMIMKSVASRVVANRLQKIWDTVDQVTAENSEGGASITMNELQRIKSLIGDKSISEAINEDLKALYGALNIAYGSGADKQLSALQQGIQGITEDTAGALEAITNGISQQCYLQSDLLTQIRDAVVGFDIDVQTASLSQILLQLQTNYIVMQSMHSMMEGWTTPSGQGIRVELLS